MSSEAITRNDLTAILNEVLPPTPSEYRKLLWTNPSPTSSFAAQTLALDVNDYDAVCVEFRGETSHTTMCERGISYYTLRPAYGATPTYRVSSLPAAGGVYFDDCHKNSGSTIDNTQLVPYKIYGIKYERVLPPTEEYTPPSGFGASTDITSYTSKAGAFTIPADGLIWMQSRYTSGNYVGVTVCNADGTNERPMQIVSYGTGNNTTMFPVFKGMKAWRSSNNGQYNYIDYIPFI